VINRYYMTRPTFQTEWVEKGGILIVLAFFLGGLAGGLYLVSLLLGFYAGMVASFVIGAITSLFYLMHLGKPLRFWMVLLRPQTSWMSRGTIAVMAFLVFVALQLAPTIQVLAWLPWDMNSILLRVLAAASAIVLIAYKGFALAVMNAIPFWNSALTPMVFIVYSVLGGAAMALGMMLSLGGSQASLSSLVSIVNWFLIIAALVLVMYIWVSYSVSPVVRHSVMELLKGHMAIFFVGGAVIVGLAIPLAIAGLGLVSQVPAGLMIVSVVCQILGVFFVTYSILKAGAYAPTI
jgi:formate-dependent nitrite reductase membrane component NrfD